MQPSTYAPVNSHYNYLKSMNFLLKDITMSVLGPSYLFGGVGGEQYTTITRQKKHTPSFFYDFLTFNANSTKSKGISNQTWIGL